MAKITLPSIASGYNPATINSNFQLIASALNDRVLYRVNVGTEPNQMINMLDMNNFRIINLPEPLTDTEPFRKKDGTVFSGQMDAKVALAQGYATQAGISAATAATSAANASASASQVINEGTQLKNELIAQGATIAQQAFQAANASQSFAQESAQSALESKGYRDTSKEYSDDSVAAAVQAQAIANDLAGGTVGFDAIAYDFGMVADPTTYFNRDFGTIV